MKRAQILPQAMASVAPATVTMGTVPPPQGFVALRHAVQMPGRRWTALAAGAAMLLGACTEMPVNSSSRPLQAARAADASPASPTPTPTPPAQSADELHRRGLAMAREGRYEEAAQRLAQAVELFPGQSALRNNLGYALMLDGKPQRACEELKVSLRLDPKNATARDNLAEVLRRLGEPQPGGLQDIEDIACEKAAPSAEATPRVSCQPAEGCMSTRDAGESARSQGSSPTIPTSSIPTSSDPHSSEPDSSGARTERSAAFALSPQTPGARLIQLAPQIYRLESSAQPVRADAPLHAVATTAATTATTAAPAPDGKPARPCPDDCARLAPSPVNARLLITNGNGRTGLAARWRRSLQTHLARLIRLGNRKGYAQRHTELLHRSGYRDAAEQLALQIGRDIKVREMPAAQLPAGVDLQLLLGHDGTSSPATAAWQPTAPTSQPAAGLPAPVALQTGAAEGLR